MSERRRCFIAAAFQLRFIPFHQEGPRKPGKIGNKWDTSASGVGR
jgi:hypothetical protein